MFCRRAVIWVKTARNKNIPLNPATDPAGTFVPFRGRAWHPWELRGLGEPWAGMADAGAHTVHIVTCPSWPRPEPEKHHGGARGHLACMCCGVVEATVRHCDDQVDRCRDCRQPAPAPAPVASNPVPKPEPASSTRRSTPRTMLDARVDQAAAQAAQALVRLEADYRAGRAVAYPDRITFALDYHDLEGPDVDVACLAVEPAVDQWEAGEAAPSWEQLVALSELTGYPVPFFTRETLEIGPVWMCGDLTCEVVAPRPPVPPWRPPATVTPLRGR
jgi:hypothetical protein